MAGASAMSLVATTFAGLVDHGRHLVFGWDELWAARPHNAGRVKIADLHADTSLIGAVIAVMVSTTSPSIVMVKAVLVAMAGLRRARTEPGHPDRHGGFAAEIARESRCRPGRRGSGGHAVLVKVDNRQRRLNGTRRRIGFQGELFRFENQARAGRQERR